MRERYPWLGSGRAYFEGRLAQVPEDVNIAAEYVSANAQTRIEQDPVIAALEQGSEILRAQLVAIEYACVIPANIPPGCFEARCP